MRLFIVVSVLTGFLFTGASLAQSGGAWIDAIPEPERAIEKISGKDELDTKSRQSAALHEIARVILRLSGNEFAGTPRMTAREQALHGRYTGFYQRFSAEYADRLNRGLSPERLAEMGNQRPSTPFVNLEYAYRSNPTFQRQTFATVMGDEWVAKWYEPLVERDRKISENARAQHEAQYEASRAHRAEAARNAALRVAVRFAGLVIFLTAAVWMARSWRAANPDPSDPMRLTGPRSGWALAPVTGFASDVRVYTVRHTSWFVKRSNDFRPDEVSVHSTTTHHCEFILNNQQGKRPIHLTDAGLQVGEGHLVSCVWPEKGARSRAMVLAYNHDTTLHATFKQSIGRAVGPRFLPGLLGALGIGLMIHWATAVLFLLAFFAAFWALWEVRTRAFTKRDVPRIIERLKALEPEVSPVVGVR